MGTPRIRIKKRSIRTKMRLMHQRKQALRIEKAKLLEQLKTLKSENPERCDLMTENDIDGNCSTIIGNELSDLIEVVKTEPEEPFASTDEYHERNEHLSEFEDNEQEKEEIETELEVHDQNKIRSSTRVANRLKNPKPVTAPVEMACTKTRKNVKSRKKLISSTHCGTWKGNAVCINLKRRKQSEKSHTKNKKVCKGRNYPDPFYSKATENNSETNSCSMDALFDEVSTKCASCSSTFANESKKRNKFNYFRQYSESTDVQILDGIFCIYGLTTKDWISALLPQCTFSVEWHKFFSNGINFCETCVTSLRNVYSAHQQLKNMSLDNSVFAKAMKFKFGCPFQSEMAAAPVVINVDANTTIMMPPFEESWDSEYYEESEMKIDPLADSSEVNLDSTNIVELPENENDGDEREGEPGEASETPTSLLENTSMKMNTSTADSLQSGNNSADTSVGLVLCCRKFFRSRGKFALHKKMFHPHNAGVHTAGCKLCGESMPVDKIEDHIMSNQRFPAVKIYKCDICGFTTYTNKCSFIKHQQAHDVVDEEIITTGRNPAERKQDFDMQVAGEINKCDYCEMILKTKEKLNAHMAGHDPVKYQAVCDICGNTFKTAAHVKAHKRSKHDNPANYDFHCEICRKGFTTQYILEQHKNRHLLPAKSLVCEKCGKSCTTSDRLRQHYEKHEDEERGQEFECEECGQKLKHRHSLQKHILVQHKSKNLFICDQCGKTTKNRVNMKIHMQVHDTTRNVKREYQYKPKDPKPVKRTRTRRRANKNVSNVIIGPKSGETQSEPNIAEEK